MSKYCMIDLETLSTRANAVILTIGAIKFEVETDIKRYRTILKEGFSDDDVYSTDYFYKRIRLDSYSDTEMFSIDEKTVQWWESQEDDVKQEALMHPDRVSLDKALQDFSDWFKSTDSNGDNIKIIGNGSSFDCTILGEAFLALRIEIPWKFWNIRDLRTIFDLGKVRMNQLPDSSKHHALFDCFRQIIGFQIAMHVINSKR